jgi:hypothetical protein
VRRRLIPVLLAVVIMLAPQSAAQADVQQASSYSYRNWFCSYGQTWVHTDWGLPGLESIATIDGSVMNFCDTTNLQTDAGNIAVRQTLWAWDARGFEFVCNVGGWQLNLQRSHDVWTWWAWSRPCNTFWYSGQGFSAIRWNAVWRGVDENPHKTPWVFTG